MSELTEHNDGNTQVAYFAGGCFWGLERYFQNVDGVTDTTVGYAQSTVESPTYEQVCAGGTDAAEAVQVTFDPARVSLRTLALLFLEVIDPFSVDQQGEDRGRQYRTGMFYTDETQRAVYVAALEQLVDRQPQRPAVLVEPLRNFYPAEAHHQDYLINNPGGYCHVPIAAIANVKRRQKYVERIWDLTRSSSSRSRRTPPPSARSSTSMTRSSSPAFTWISSAASRCSLRGTSSTPAVAGPRFPGRLRVTC